MGDIGQKLLVVGAAGIGKSQQTIAQLHDVLRANPETTIWYLTPTIDLAQELASAFGQGAVVIRGRTHQDGNGQTLCLKSDAVRQVAGRVSNITRAMCFRRDDAGKTIAECEHFRSCPYFKQFEHARRVMFMSHEYAFHAVGERLPRPDLIVIDESVLPALIAQPRPFTTEEFIKSAGRFSPLAGLIVNELRADRSPKPALRQRGWKKKRLKKVAARLGKDVVDDIRPGMDERAIRRALKHMPNNSVAAMVFRKLADEMVLRRDAVYSVTLVRDVEVRRHVGRDETRSRETLIYVQYRRKLAVKANTAMLLLDGTANHNLMDVAFPGIKSERIAATRNAFIVQTYGFRASKAALTDPTQGAKKHLAGVQAFLDQIACLASGLLITHKGAEEALQVGSNWSKAHFGDIRGLDNFKDKEIAVVLGRMQPGIEAVERLARGLVYDQEKELTLLGAGQYPEQERGFRMRDGSRWGVAVPVHPDRIVQSMLEQIREAEIVQAIDRLRLRWNDIPKLIFILGEVPVDVTIDALVPYRSLLQGSRIDVAASRLGGFLPTSPGYLAREFPDLWPTQQAAKRDLQREAGRRSGGCISGPVFYRYFYRKEGRFLPAFYQFAYPYRYRLRSQRGSASICLSMHDAAETRHWLELTLGPLAAFEVHQREAPANTESRKRAPPGSSAPNPLESESAEDLGMHSQPSAARIRTK